MKTPIINEFVRLFSATNRRPTLILLVSVVVIVTWKTAGSQSFYHHHVAGLLPLDDSHTAAAWYQMVMTLLLLGVVPACLVRLVFGESLTSVGFGRGNLRVALVQFALAVPFIFWISYATAGEAEFRAVYPLNRDACQSTSTFAAHVASLSLFYLAWEFHFRGFLQMGLGASIGPAAGLWVQVLASCLLHFDRPDAELWASIPVAVFWGVQAKTTGSIWAGFAQHFLLGVTLDYFICFA